MMMSRCYSHSDRAGNEDKWTNANLLCLIYSRHLDFPIAIAIADGGICSCVPLLSYGDAKK
jgi:hypothetical protein